MLYVVDTHALIWFLADDSRIGKMARRLMSDSRHEFVLPAIVIAEVLFIIMRKRVTITYDELWQHIDDLENVIFVDLTRAILRLTENLPHNLEMHDRQIIATALYFQNQGHKVKIITKDQLITRSGIIPTLWD